jgi:hypothetical protein
MNGGRQLDGYSPKRSYDCEIGHLSGPKDEQSRLLLMPIRGDGAYPEGFAFGGRNANRLVRQ